ncbi:MAG: IspD/TarI family cytidylyltransferase [Chloroflexota bacterium]
MSSVGVILAAGQGRRMGADRNKALLPLAGKALLAYSVAALASACTRLMVVASLADLEAIRELGLGCEVVLGGGTRQASEWSALRALAFSLSTTDVVAIHDAARPLVSPRDVAAVLEAAAIHGAAMLAEPATLPAIALQAIALPASSLPSGRRSSRDIASAAATCFGPAQASPSESIGEVGQVFPAARLWKAQTPQAARAALLLSAYQQAESDGFLGTDTAAVLQHAGHNVRVVAASAPNPKVTIPADLHLAEALLAGRSAPA